MAKFRTNDKTKKYYIFYIHTNESLERKMLKFFCTILFVGTVLKRLGKPSGVALWLLSEQIKQSVLNNFIDIEDYFIEIVLIWFSLPVNT